jgi:hypothetical protein
MSSVVTRCLGLLVSVSAAFLLTASPASAATSPEGWRPFAPDSIWNLPLRDDAPLDPAGDAQVRWLRGQIATAGSWINTTSCAMPLFWADTATPRIAVTLDPSSYQDRVLIRAWSSVPMPPEAKVSNCQDKNFAVLQTQPDGTVSMWEFWSATKRADGSWTARWGGATQDVMADRGVASKLSWNDPTATSAWLRTSTINWNVTATSIAMNAGVITHDDMRRGTIDHALAMAITDAAAGRWSWPAQRTDGGSADPAALPEGARLRLDPTLNIDALTMTPLVRMMAKAAQRYGIVVRDRTWAANVFYTEEPRTGETSPARALLNYQYPNTALAAFPWDRLQVVASPSCTVTPCVVEPRAAIAVDTPTPRAGLPVALDTTASVLEHPRTLVEWDFDGDGSYEKQAGRAVKATFVPANAGRLTVGVRITTREGLVTTGSATLDVAPPLTPIVRRPTVATPKYFYPYSGSWSLLASLTATTEPPATPDRYRRAYTSHTAGTLDVQFGAEGVPSPGDATVRAHVECSGARCLRLTVHDAAGATLASAEPGFDTSGWVEVRVPGPLTAAQVDALRLRATARNASTASGTAKLAAVSLAAGWR